MVETVNRFLLTNLWGTFKTISANSDFGHIQANFNDYFKNFPARL